MCENKWNTSSYIEAQIKNNGDLVLSGQNIGSDSLEFWGDLDHEYWLTVLSENKDRVHKALIEHCKQTLETSSSRYQNKVKAPLDILEQNYGGHRSAFEEIRGWLKANDIPAEFHSHD